jgi:hypothetical protein
MNKIKLKAILTHDNLDNYVENHLNKRKNDIEKYLNAIENIDIIAQYDVMPHLVGIEWLDSREDFEEDGYTEEDILFGDWDEAAEASMEEYIDDMAYKILEEFFNDDPDYYNSIVKYIHNKV